MAKQKYYQRPDGLYESIRKINGKRVAFRGKTCREVDRKILAYQEQAQAGRPFPVVAAEWQREHDKTVTLSSQRVYGYAVKRLCKAFPGSIRDIRPLDVKRHINHLEQAGYSAQTVQIGLSVCKMIFSYAVLAGDIDVSPAGSADGGAGGACQQSLRGAQGPLVAVRLLAVLHRNAAGRGPGADLWRH